MCRHFLGGTGLVACASCRSEKSAGRSVVGRVGGGGESSVVLLGGVRGAGVSSRLSRSRSFWAKKASSLVRFGQGVAKVGEEASARVAQE